MVRKWSEVLDIISGKNQKNVESPDGEYPIYGSGGIIGKATEYLCKPGTTIIGRKGTINNPIFVDSYFWNVDTAFGLSPKEGLLPKYLYYFCVLFNFTELDKSTTIPSLAKRDLLNISMPVPSLEKQANIVSRIDELFSVLDRAEETLLTTKSQLEVYRQAVLKEAFEGNYPEVPLGDISKAISGYAFKSARYSDDGEYVVVKIGNVKERRFDFSRDLTKTTETESGILEKYLLQRGDCLITMTGSRGKRDYGFVAMITDQDKFLLNQRVAALRFDLEKANPEFFQYYLASPVFRDSFFSYETGNVGQGNVGIKALTEPMVILPSLSDQSIIVQKIEEKMSICQEIEKTVNGTIEKLSAMRQSILKQAFEGRLS